MTTDAPVNESTTQGPSQSNRLISVLEDPVNYNIKHPLQYGWSLWLKKSEVKDNSSQSHSNHSGKTSMEIWKESVENLGANVRTVEDFWCLYNNIPTPGQLPPNSDYFFFKDGIVPMWEDPRNANGGMLSVTFGSGRDRSDPKAGPSKPSDWEGIWLNAMLACIACMPQKHDQITGVNFGRRTRGDRIQVWFSSFDEETKRSLEQDFTKALNSGLPQGAPPLYIKLQSFSSHGGASAGGKRDGHGSRRDSRPH